MPFPLIQTGFILRDVVYRPTSTINSLKKVVLKEEDKKSELINEFSLSCPQPNVDVEYLCNPSNTEEIMYNLSKRKGVGDIQKVLDHFKLLQSLSNKPTSQEYTEAYQQFIEEAIKIPNRSHHDISQYGENPHVLRKAGPKPNFSFKALSFKEIAKSLNVMQTENISNFSGQRSYFFMGQLAELESALVQWSLKTLLSRGFQLISVPDILNRNIIESCGMATKGDRHQVSYLYKA